jgi:cation:H+ antiporter
VLLIEGGSPCYNRNQNVVQELDLIAILIDFGLLVVGAVLLLLGADWFMDGVRDMARAFGMSALVLGVLIAGLEPEEMLTAALAAGRGAPALAVGNVIGTNVTIVTFALGLSALLYPIVLDLKIRRQALIATGVSLLPIALLFLGYVSRIEGAILLAIFVGYTIVLLRTGRKGFERIEAAEKDEKAARMDEVKRRRQAVPLWELMALTIGGLLALSIGGPAIVEGALRLASHVGLAEGVVGATIVSLGTGAEMIALGVAAARKKQADILVGGILGSFAYNLLVTLGLAAVIHPLPVDAHLRFALYVMVAAHIVLLLLVWRGRLGRFMGGVFVLGYIAYLGGVVFL